MTSEGPSPEDLEPRAPWAKSKETAPFLRMAKDLGYQGNYNFGWGDMAPALSGKDASPPSASGLLTDPELRKPYEEDMRLMITRGIERARQAVIDSKTKEVDPVKKRRAFESALLLRDSIINSPNVVDQKAIAAEWAPHIKSRTFASWFFPFGCLLGPNPCFDIGKEVCEREGFTREEAEAILEALGPKSLRAHDARD